MELASEFGQPYALRFIGPRLRTNFLNQKEIFHVYTFSQKAQRARETCPRSPRLGRIRSMAILRLL